MAVWNRLFTDISLASSWAATLWPNRSGTCTRRFCPDKPRVRIYWQKPSRLGQLFSFNAQHGYIPGLLQNLINLQPGLREAYVAARRVGEVLDLSAEQNEKATLLRPQRVIGPIGFENADSGYGSKKLVLQAVSFTVPAGTSVGIAGPSGSG